MMIVSSSIFIFIFIGAYLIGSIPSGYIVARYNGFQDIRQFGSGSIGATNIARAFGLHYFFIVLFLDAFKAYAYLVTCFSIGIPGWALFVSAFALLLGNGYSLFLNGSGGKGIATLVGIMFAMNTTLCIMLILMWLFVLSIIRSVGIASVLTALVSPLYAILFTDIYGFFFMIIVAIWIVWRHRDNIRIYYMAR